MHETLLTVIEFLLIFVSVNATLNYLLFNYFRNYELRDLILSFDAFYLNTKQTRTALFIAAFTAALWTGTIYESLFVSLLLLISVMDLRLNLIPLRSVYCLVALKALYVGELLEPAFVLIAILVIAFFPSVFMLGTGDILLLLALKVHFNTLEWLNMILLACIIGIVFGLTVRTILHKKLIPFGPCICFSACVFL